MKKLEAVKRQAKIKITAVRALVCTTTEAVVMTISDWRLNRDIYTTVNARGYLTKATSRLTPALQAALNCNGGRRERNADSNTPNKSHITLDQSNVFGIAHGAVSSQQV